MISNERRRQLSTESLLAAAAQLFLDQGFRATTVEQIVEAAGYTRGAVYFHFGNKAGLLMRLLDEVEAVAIEPLVAAVAAAGPSARDQFVAWAHAEARVGEDRADAMVLAIRMSIEFHGSADPVEARVTGLLDQITGLLRSIIERGQAQGAFRTDLGARDLADAVMAVSVGAFMEGYRRRGDIDGKALARAGRSLLLAGLATPKGAVAT